MPNTYSIVKQWFCAIIITLMILYIHYGDHNKEIKILKEDSEKE